VHTTDRRATAPTGIRRLLTTVLPSRTTDPIAAEPLPHRRPRPVPPPLG
jgi:hypothetical protein